MMVLNAAELMKAGHKNAPLRKALDQWLQTTEAAAWENINDVRATFSAADGVVIGLRGGIQIVATVFNVKGNQYRLITVIDYERAVVRVVEVLAHAQYSKDQWKGRL